MCRRSGRSVRSAVGRRGLGRIPDHSRERTGVRSGGRRLGIKGPNRGLDRRAGQNRQPEMDHYPSGRAVYAIRPAHNLSLTLAASRGKSAHGTSIVLEPDRGEPWQTWELKKNEDGSYCLVPRHAPDMGLDHFGGRPEPGARIDLWTNNPGDPHLQWIIKPLAGTIGPAANGAIADAAGTYFPPKINPERGPSRSSEAHDVHRQHHFPRHRTAGDGLHPRAIRSAPNPPASTSRPTATTRRKKRCWRRLIATREMPVTVGVFVSPASCPRR